MNYKLTNRITALVVFLISLIVLLMTMQPSVSFWDCGEFIAASYSLQVPHPPGAPFFLLLGRIFSILPLGSNVAYEVNLISVLSSALSVLFLYLISVKLIENIRGLSYSSKEYVGNKPALIETIAVYFAAAIGALSFSFSDTFWFNGVEAEVYAFSTFLFAAIVWLIMEWYEKSEEVGSEKYIYMIAYLLGISIGVHLMALLAIVPVVMIISFKKYIKDTDDEATVRKSGYLFLAHVFILLVVAFALWAAQTGVQPPSPEEYKAFDMKFIVTFLIISAIIIGAFYKLTLRKNSFYFPLLIGIPTLGLTYPGVVKLVPKIMVAIAGNNTTMGIISLLIIFAAFGYLAYYASKNGKPTLHLAAMTAVFILIGFTSFAMVIIRSNQNPPMNENEPDKFTELISYLNREQYGDFPNFKRRFTAEAHQQGVYTNYSSDLDFFWTYQMNHMMTRYFLWNYAGREGWNQDAGVNIAPFNSIGNIFGKILGVKFGGEAKDSLFAIPLLFGLLGIYFHFKKNWKMASVFMILFIFMGYLTAFYQNQQQPQPRERDYFYVGAFFVYSIWIAIGVIGLIDLLGKRIKSLSAQKAVVFGVILFAFIFIPVNMIRANYYTHDRSKSWIPWDYSYNLLQSCAPNSILFTNGDNDTFPLWYLQDVEGVRRDVKIVNLSLLNTDWYIRQLKNNDPYKVGKVAMNLTDEQIIQMQPYLGNPIPALITVPRTPDSSLPQDVLQTLKSADSSVVREGKIGWTIPGTPYGQYKLFRVQDIMVYQILKDNNWKRPIYFAVTCSEDSKIGLGDYLKMEGMAMRFVPEKRKPGQDFINPEILRAQLFNENPSFSKDYKMGMKFRGLNDPSIFLDENHRRLIINYRFAFIRLANYYNSIKQPQQAIETMNLMDTKMPISNVPAELPILFQMGEVYYNAGSIDKYKAVSQNLIAQAEKQIASGDEQDMFNAYYILFETYDRLKDYRKAIDMAERLKANFSPQDPNVIYLDQKINLYRMMLSGKDTSTKNLFNDTTKK